MISMFFTVISKFIGSYGSVVMEISKDWFILYRIFFIPLSLFIYCLAFLVVLSVLLIVIFIATPISFISNALFK
jgi:hypothetical protein